MLELCRRFGLGALLVIFVGPLLSRPVGAQSPVGDPFLLSIPDGRRSDFPSHATLANGDVLVVWETADSFDEGPAEFQARSVNVYSPPGESRTLARGEITDNNIGLPFVAPREDGGFLLTFFRDDAAANDFSCRAIAFDSSWRPLAGEIKIRENGGCGEGLVALADGTFATSWLEENDPPAAHLRAYRMFARLSPLGELIGRPRRINPTPLQFGRSAYGASLAGNANGDMTLVWDGHPARARSFSAYGGPLPPLTFVGFTAFGGASAVVLPNGERIFVGENQRLDESNYVVYQRFSKDGHPLGKIRPAHTPRHAIYGIPSAGTDRSGNFAIAWGSEPTISCNRVEARLFRADGTPVTREFFVSLKDRCEGRPLVSFSDNGTFALSWVDESGINVAWYSASPGDEPCLTRGGRLLCDTGRTGGPPEIDQPIDRPASPPAADALFLADADGDGRADPCYRSGVTFRCDLGHRGHGPRIGIDFGTPSDLPLMGDVDGDGRAEACVRRGDLLACDTGHDGGKAELQERFGDPGAVPLLGDLDGDGRYDLCLYRDGVFSCDLAHDGGAPELTVRFGAPGDLPVLGDFDGDGRADPCVLRGDTLLCDTKHDGGAAEASLKLTVQPGDGILMGNLDGL